MHLTGWIKLLSELSEVRKRIAEIEDKVMLDLRRMAESQEAEKKRESFLRSIWPERIPEESNVGPESPTTPTSGNT